MKKYDKEFKKEAIRKYFDGQSIASIARETGVSQGVLDKWKNEILSENGEADKEKLAMRKRILELEIENESLKKAALIFSRSPWGAISLLKWKEFFIRSGCYGRVMEVSKRADYSWRNKLNQQLEHRLKLGVLYEKHDLVFASEFGKPVHYRNLTQWHFDKGVAEF